VTIVSVLLGIRRLYFFGRFIFFKELSARMAEK
jgi:hypothetical protein